jgi:glutathione S-transferase
MVVMGETPSPWGEAAKGILHMKRLAWSAVRLVYDNEALARWAGQSSAPVLFHDDEPPRAGWAEILLLAERLAPTPALLPADPFERAIAFGLSHEIFGQDGLAWSRRLQLVHAGLQAANGFSERVARHLGAKYGYRPDMGEHYGLRVEALLRMLAARLHAQRAAGLHYYVGDTAGAVDIYSATCMALFAPLPQAQCEMRASTRAAFETRDARTAAALDPILLEHRDRMYAEHLALPLSL